jgi:hypothetical protein
MSVPGMTGGEQKPLVKYNARTAKWHVDDKVIDKITLLVDLAHGETGWVRFSEGVAPDFRMTTMAAMVAGGQFPAMPPDVDAQGKPLFKRGFRLMCKISDQMANGRATVREWASCSLATVRAVDKLHSDWLAADMVPVVTTEGYIEVPGAFGKNYAPMLKILKWVPRPPDLKPDASLVQVQQPPTRVTAPIGEPEQFDTDEDSPW